MTTSFEAELKIYEKAYALYKKGGGKVKPAEMDALGYTSKDGTIYIQENNEYIKSLKPNQKRMFRCGVFTHELMHQIFTNFVALEKRLNKLPNRSEKEIYATLSNILEDPAIERFAPSVIGGRYLRALKYTILKVYKQSPNINESNNAFAQFVNALIQFGDIGPLKGEFTFPEAKECFKKVATKFYEGINEINPFKRLEIVNFIFETSRPLWEAMNEQQKNDLKELLDELGKNMSKGSGEGKEGVIIVMPGKGDKSSDEITKDDLRKNTIIILDEPQENDDDENSESKNNDDGKNQENNSSTANSADNKNNDKDNKNKDANDSNINSSENSNSENSEKNNTSSNKSKKVKFKPLSKEKIADKLNSLEEDSKESIEESKSFSDEIKKEIAKEKREEREELVNTAIESKKYGLQSVINEYPPEGNSDSYASIVAQYKSKINATANKFKQIFEFDKDEKVHKNSGKVNLIRVNSATLTSRVFDRNYVSANFSDTSVMILVDESGSMHGKRIKNARECAIALAEIFAKINLPIYILGFTADEGSDLNHIHYVTWNKNNKKNRISLTNIRAKSNNRDGMTIRYATNILEKRLSNHKLMIVISDGQPAASYYNGKHAVEDTKKAVDEARKQNIRVLGVAIGNDINELHSIYKNDFLIVEDVNLMFNKITKKLKKIFKGED